MLMLLLGHTADNDASRCPGAERAAHRGVVWLPDSRRNRPMDLAHRETRAIPLPFYSFLFVDTIIMNE